MGPHREGGPVPAAALVLARRVQEGEYESAHETRARSRLPNTRPLSFPQVLLWTTTVLSASGVAATEDALYLCRETVSGVGESAERVEREWRERGTRARDRRAVDALSHCAGRVRALHASRSRPALAGCQLGRPGRPLFVEGGVVLGA